MYSFIDTTKYYATNNFPAEALSINGVYLEDEISGYRTLQVTGREIMEAEVSNKQIGISNGADYQYKRIPTREITVKFSLRSSSAEDFREKFNKINEILDQEEATLIFYDEPDKYFTGTKSSVKIPDGGLLNVTGTFTFLCSNPYKHSTATKTFTAEENDDGILEMTITNDGTVAVPISYEITHNAENGFIGIVSEDGVIQLGKVDEADGETYEQNETLTKSSSPYAWSGDSNWVNDTGTNGQNSANKTSGSFSVVTAGGYSVLSLGSKGTSTSGTWNGAMKTFDVVDSNGDTGAVNFYCYVNSWFETGKMGQTGCQTIAFLDEDDNMICSQVLVKTDTSGNTARANFHVGGNNPRKVKTVDFVPSTYNKDNPYNQARGHSDMRKEGSKITFYWWGTYPSFTVPELASVKVAKVQIYIGQYGTRSLSTAYYITRNYFRRITLQVMNVEKWRDVPNRYQDGDVVTIEGDTRRVYVNGMAKAGDEATGSTYFDAQPGETTVQFTYSDFCETAPTVTASIREAYL